MKISYTGRHEAFPPKQRAKLEAKLQKLSKMLERKGEKEAHLILSQERFLHKVEITLNAMDHAMVGVGADSDVVVAAHGALDKLEKQVLKVRNKWRDTKRRKDKPAAPAAAATKAPAVHVKSSKARAAIKHGNNDRPKKVFRVSDGDGRKPLTL